jgi:hypothetical protein
LSVKTSKRLLRLIIVGWTNRFKLQRQTDWRRVQHLVRGLERDPSQCSICNDLLRPNSMWNTVRWLRMWRHSLLLNLWPPHRMVKGPSINLLAVVTASLNWKTTVKGPRQQSPRRPRIVCHPKRDRKNLLTLRKWARLCKLWSVLLRTKKNREASLSQERDEHQLQNVAQKQGTPIKSK